MEKTVFTETLHPHCRLRERMEIRNCVCWFTLAIGYLMVGRFDP